MNPLLPCLLVQAKKYRVIADRVKKSLEGNDQDIFIEQRIEQMEKFLPRKYLSIDWNWSNGITNHFTDQLKQ